MLVFVEVAIYDSQYHFPLLGAIVDVFPVFVAVDSDHNKLPSEKEINEVLCILFKGFQVEKLFVGVSIM